MQRLTYKTSLYWRMGWALLIVFGMVGNCSGRHDAAVLVFVVAAVVWVCLRILIEGVEAWGALRYLRLYDEAIKEQAKKQSPPPPSEPGPEA